MRVLIADDDARTNHRLTVLLRQWGYDPVTVQDGRAALAVLRGPAAPSLVVLDGMMPGLNGMHICHEIRQDIAGLHTYVIVATDHVGHERMLFGLESGADDYLVKPVDAGELQVRLSIGRRVLALEAQLLAARRLLQRQAMRDALTGLRSRARTLEILNRELVRSRRECQLLSVIMAEVDHFQCIKDRFGQGAGNKVLHQTAHAFRAALLPGSTVGRYGSKRFLVVLPDCGAGLALQMAEHLRKAVATEPVMQEGELIAVTLSLGVAGWDGRQSASELLRTARAALYHAKRAGRNRAMYYEGLSAIF